MARINSKMVPLGTKSQNFELYDTVSKTTLSLTNLKGSLGTIVLFICNHCPYVIHINPVIVEIANKYKKLGINTIAISSNDKDNYPEDGPLEMSRHAKENKYNFPYLFDESQEVAKKYDAACTPDIYLYNNKNILIYRGQIDASIHGNDIPLSGNDLINALDCLIKKVENNRIQKPSIGCNIKWKT